ncbi:MAG: hypothetical protein BGO94_13035 [Micrococcales bacterium 72-143]|nr:MAG: hypothetical protein BGO94_13035 [Micrococcales bacterium 72-143]
MHRSTINERAQNTAAAAAFFTRRRGTPELRLLRDERAEVHAEALTVSEERRRAELAAQIQADTRRPARIRALLDKYLATPAGARIREEVRMDSIARQRRGAGAYPDLEKEALRRAAAILIARRAAGQSARSPVERQALGSPSAGRAVGF